MQAKLKRENGRLKISIDDTLYEPLSFKSFRPTARNISEFYQAGVRLFSILSSGLNSILGVPYSLYGESWVGEEEYDFEPVDRQIALFMKQAPEAYFALMVQVDTRPWYLAARPGCPDSFTHLSQIAADEHWRNAAAAYLRAVISHVEEKFGDRFYGYFILGGTTTEWFSRHDLLKPHPIKEAAYRAYCKDDFARIPEDALAVPEDRIFLDGEAERDVVSYMRFHNELISDTILYFAAQAQRVLKHQKLLGVYFGYLLELNGYRLWSAGSLGYEKVFLSKDIDMISSPSSYEFRKHDDTSAFMVTYDTLDAHDKLYYLEFDHITHLAPQYIDGIPIPGYASKFQNEQETIDVMRRDFMLCITKGAALWWFDMFEGWFYSDGMMEQVQKMIGIAKRTANTPMEPVSEIAVFAEGESLYYINKNTDINNDLLNRQRKGLLQMGAPYDMYSIADLKRAELPRYKLIVFLDQFAVSDETHEEIAKLKAMGKSLLFVCGTGCVTDDGVSASAMSTLIGMELSQIACPERTVEAFGGQFGFKKEYTGLFCVTDNAAKCLGVYQNSKRCAFAKKGSCYFCGVGNLPGGVLREIARNAGVHIYGDERATLYVNNRLLGVYPNGDGEVQIAMPDDCTLTELFDGGTYETNNHIFSILCQKGRAKLFWIEKNSQRHA